MNRPKGKGNKAKKPTSAPQQSSSTGMSSRNTSTTRLESIQEALQKRREKRAAHAASKAKGLQSMKERGNSFFKSGLYDVAATIYSEALDTYGPDPTILSNLAATLLKLESYDDAEDAATQALRYDPHNIKARYRRGLARKELGFYKAAMVDFETVMRHDPSCTEAKQHYEEARFLSELTGEDDEDLTDMESVDDWPCFDDEADTISDGSESSDYFHAGNGIPCRYYNHQGCNRGEDCGYCHAPDSRSVRDELGKNVCFHFLLDRCKYGPKCVYSHTAEYLPKGWWHDPEEMSNVRSLLDRFKDGEFSMEALQRLRNDMASQSHQKPTSNKSSKGPKATPDEQPLHTGIAVMEDIDEPETLAEAILQADSAPTIPAEQPVEDESAPPPVPPCIMVLSLMNRDYFADIYKLLLSALSAKAKVVTATTAKAALDYLGSSNLSGVLVVDSEIVEKKHSNLLAKLIEFTKTGGSVVLAAAFSSFVSPPALHKFFKEAWDLDWESASYHRTTFSVNKEHELIKGNPSLIQTYSMKALHVKDYRPDQAVYITSEGARLESLVWSPRKIGDVKESPIVQAQIGDGHLGYIGDVNGEEGSDKVVLAMLGLLDPVKAKPRSGKKRATSDFKEIMARQVEKLRAPDAFILFLSLENESFFADIHAHLIETLESKIQWKQAFNASSALDMLASPDLAGVFVTDPGIVRHQSAQVLKKLVQYVREGGSIVIGGLFSTFVPWNDMEKFFNQAWGVTWKPGSYHRTTFVRNMSHSMIQANSTLPSSYSMKALHVGHLGSNDALYLPSEDSHLESMVFPPMPINDLTESPAVQTQVGKGLLGYLGDVNAEKASTDVVLAMLGLLDSFDRKTEGEGSSDEDLANGVAVRSDPFVMILSFKSEATFTTEQSKFLSALKGKVEVLHGLSKARVLDLLPSPDLLGLIVTDAEVASIRTRPFAARLAEYVKAGGTIVLTGSFTRNVTPGALEFFFKKWWDLPWSMGGRTQTPIKANAEHDMVKAVQALPGSLTVHGPHLKGVSPSAVVYSASQGSQMYKPLKDVTQAAVLRTNIEKGRLAYVGEMNLNDEHWTSVVFAMLGIA